MSSPATASSPRSARLPDLVGTSAVITELHRDIEAASRSRAKVLIVGETGVGKEVVARLIHAKSALSARPFVAVNCSGIPETLLASELFGHTRGSFTGAYRDKIGLVRQADRGTLFLDELGEMSLAMQAALLRFTETGEIQPVGADAPAGRTDVRLITATNRNLRAQIEAGAFREDLFYRLNVIQIRVPPLRDRGDDIVLLFDHYLKEASSAHAMRVPELSAAATDVLRQYAWPGNVRELKNMSERLVLRDLGRQVRPEDLPAEVRSGVAAVAVAAPPVEPAASEPQPRRVDAHASAAAQGLWDRLLAGEDFWTVVQQPFRARQLTRADLAALIDRGLQHTRGSYRALVRLFNLPPEDYKRFHAFLYQQNCNLPVAPYRNNNSRGRSAAPVYPAAC
jgi:DNA-binding NtrC family response regulator